MPAVAQDRSAVTDVLDRVERCARAVSLGFERWDDAHARGPGLYFVVARGSVTDCTEPMGTNRWPVETCGSVFDSPDALFEAAEAVASSCDGAVIVRDDGTIRPEMVRLKQLSTATAELVDDLPYAGWMGARHMSALETSTRDSVAATITLSEEDGRVTVFADGAFDDSPRDVIGD